MNGADVLRIVDMMHREKNIPKDVIFEGIEAALQLATEKHYGDEADIAITIDRDSGEIQARRGEQVIDPELLGRIAAQSAIQVMIPNALQPAQIEEVFLYPRLGRAIVLVKEDQLSLAIGRRGQNVRLASKLVGWDIEIMTHDELNEGIEKAENWFRQIPGATDELVEAFIEEGFLSYDDLTFLEPAQLAELAGATEDQAEEIIAFAEEAAERVEEETRLAKEREAE